MKNSLTIVMYHYVRPIKKSKYKNIKGLELDSFIRQLRYIKNNYNVIKLKDFIEAELANVKLAKNNLVLSFDDGYLDHYEYVLPALNKFKISGIFFPIGKSLIEKKFLMLIKYISLLIILQIMMIF